MTGLLAVIHVISNAEVTRGDRLIMHANDCIILQLMQVNRKFINCLSYVVVKYLTFTFRVD